MIPLPFPDFRLRVQSLYAGPAHSRRTAAKMRRVLCLLEAMGATSTADLTTELAARFVAARSERVCANTVRGELSYLSAAAGYAVDEGWLDRPPRLKRIRPRPSLRKRKTLHSIEDVGRVLELLRSRSADWRWHRAYALASTIAYTGLRRDEALWARVEDLRLEAGVLEVSNRRRLKTEASAAPVPVCPELGEILGEWLPRCGPDWLFPAVRGRAPWTSGELGHRPVDWIRGAGEELGILGLTFQSLRHTFATWARRRWGLSGIQLKDVLRHTTEHTQEHYVHGELEHGPLVASVAMVSYRAR